MATVRAYPHYVINVIDNSIFDAAVTMTTMPIHRPLYFMRTRKGPVGVPVWCNTLSEAQGIFGAETFDPLNATYYSDAAAFLNYTFAYNGAFIVRALSSSDSTSKAANMVVYATYTAGVAAVPEVPADGETPAVPGTPAIPPSVALSVEPLVSGSYDAISVSNHKYPLLAFKATSPGEWGNLVGFKLGYNTTANAGSDVTKLRNIKYRFSAAKKATAADIAVPIADRYNQASNDVMIEPNLLDPSTGTQMSFADIMTAAFATGKLPFSIYVYHENFKTIGDALIAEGAVTDDELGLPTGIVAQWMDDSTANAFTAGTEGDPSTYTYYGPIGGHLVNILTGVSRKKTNGVYDTYAGFTVTDTAFVAKGATIMLSGGADGDISEKAIETYIKDVCGSSAANPGLLSIPDNATGLPLTDSARFPFTHVFDIGYTTDTKKALINILNWREDVKAIVSTQEMWALNQGSTKLVRKTTFNTEAQDTGSGVDGLKTYALAARESILMGTEACRVTIVSQTGRTLTGAKPWMPLTLWHAVKKAQYQSKTYMDKEPKGLPYSAVEMFSEFNWTPATEDTKSEHWDKALNYVQYYDREAFHYASIRSVYPYDTSVLVDDIFTDAIIYTKHEIRKLWATYTGVTRPAAILQSQIINDATRVLGKLYNNKYVFTVTVSQSEEEKKIGYIQHVYINITSPATNRVWLVDVSCNREGYSSTNA